MFFRNNNEIGVQTNEINDHLTKDLANWMNNLPDQLKRIPFIYLAIPGSHNSMTYTINSNSEVAPDAYTWLQKLKFLGKPLAAVVSRWAITQNASIADQLEHGIRYFDLRITLKPGRKDFYICHGLYGSRVNECFDEVNEFLKNHTKELIIFDFQHFYKLTQEDHIRLIEQIKQAFDRKIVYFSNNLGKFTLNYLTVENELQIVVIYRSNIGPTYQFWPGNYYPTPWPRTASVPQLFKILDNGLKKRYTTAGYVTQCIITPDSKFIFKNLFSNLHNACARCLHAPLTNWLNQQSPGKGNLNVTIADFVDMNNWAYSKTVINLNKKLLVEI